MIFQFNLKIILTHIALFTLTLFLPIMVAGNLAVLGMIVAWATMAKANTCVPTGYNRPALIAGNLKAAKLWGIFALCGFYVATAMLSFGLATGFSGDSVYPLCGGCLMYAIGLTFSNEHHKNAKNWANQ